MNRRFKKGFTLIELMIAVSILSIGIVVILHARLGVITALDTAVNKMRAWQFLESKMGVLEQIVREDGGIEIQGQQEDVRLGSRYAKWTLEMVSVEMQESEEGTLGQQKGEYESRLLEVVMSLSWMEERRNKNVVLVAYFPEKTE